MTNGRGYVEGVSFGNVIHEESEGQKTACSRTFDAIAQAIHHIPIVDDLVVVKDGAFKYNMGKVQGYHDDGSISVFFKTKFSIVNDAIFLLLCQDQFYSDFFEDHRPSYAIISDGRQPSVQLCLCDVCDV